MAASNHWRVESARNAWEAMEQIHSGTTPNLLLLDLPRGVTDGLDILRWLRRLRPALAIVLISHADDAGRKQEALRMGARGFLIRPVEHQDLEISIRQHLSESGEDAETDMSSDDVEEINEDTFFIGVCPVMRKLRDQATLLAEANVPVLILGEIGSGKETVARLIHKLSLRSGFDFAKVNCAFLPGELLERELFGYHRSDAASLAKTRTGKLEHCTKGTVFLDEITEMSMDLQSNLLQVLQKKWFIRPGTATPVDVDVRILASSSTNAERAISESRLREELYYRLSTYTIHVPPLRDRREEIPFFLRHFMHQVSRHYNLAPREFSSAVVEACQSHSWPGNLRELENFVKRYLMMGEGELNSGIGRPGKDGLLHAHSGGANGWKPATQPLIQPSFGNPYPESLKSLVQSVKLEAETNAIAAALEKTGWNRKAAARLLKVSYRSLLQKIDQYHMKESDSSLFSKKGGIRSKANECREGSQPIDLDHKNYMQRH